MNSATWQFVIFMLFGLATLVLGYAARRRGWLDESLSRPIHFHTVTWIWSAVALLSIWRMPIDPETAWLLVIVPAMVIVPALVAIPLARWWLGNDRNAIGVMAISAGVSNTGSTMGAFLCYVMLDPPEASRGYGIVYVTIMAAFGIIVLYPMAAHFAPHEQGVPKSISRLMLKSFICLPALSMYTAIVGVILSITHVPFPQWITDYKIITVMFYAASFGGYLGIGLRLRLGNPMQYFKHHLFLVFIRFTFAPLLAWLIIQAIQQTPWAINPVMVRAIILESYMPAAVFSVMTANLFHLDVRLASATWLVNTLLFVVLPLPFLLWLI